MKRVIVLLLIIVFMIVGCGLGNTPTSKVEDMLTKYQKMDSSIVIDVTDIMDVDLDEDTISRYSEVIKKQYRNMSYEIKEEIIDGNTATVSVQIEVMDYKTVLDKYEENYYSDTEYASVVIDELEKVTDKITYTIDFKLTKEDSEWYLNDLTSEEKNKLLGIY